MPSCPASASKSLFGVVFQDRIRESDPLTQSDLDAGILYAQRYAAKYSRRFPRLDPDQVESFAIFGAYQAWEKYDPTRRGKDGRKATWRTFLISWVNWSIAKGIRPSQATSREYFAHQFTVVPLDGHRLLDDNDRFSNLHNHEFVGDDSPSFTERTEWKQILILLPQLERWVIVQRYYYNRSCNEIASSMVVSGDWTGMKVWRLEQRALKMLRSFMGVCEN
jgi:DNA-directed RNA polymerase specialized sigma subunit